MLVNNLRLISFRPFFQPHFNCQQIQWGATLKGNNKLQNTQKNQFQRYFRDDSRGGGGMRVRRRTRLTPDYDSNNGIPGGEGRRTIYTMLAKPLCFTIGFGCCSFVGATIWQYENVRNRTMAMWNRNSLWVRDRWNAGGYSPSLKDQLKEWWGNMSEGHRVAIGIIALNALVFSAWRIPIASTFMIRYFTSNPAAKVVCWPMILSTFSHFSFWHFAVNMYVLYSFSTAVVSVLGKEQFLALYLSAGVFSSFASYFNKIVALKPGLSLGASGCLMGVLGFFCTQFPNAKLAIVFLPMFSFTADMALKGILVLDGLGVLLGWKFFDHAAHLGGVLFGICYAKWGRQYVWEKREPLVRWWNRIRGKP